MLKLHILYAFYVLAPDLNFMSKQCIMYNIMAGKPLVEQMFLIAALTRAAEFNGGQYPKTTIPCAAETVTQIFMRSTLFAERIRYK